MREIKFRYVNIDRNSVANGNGRYKMWYFTLDDIQIHSDKWLAMCDYNQNTNATRGEAWETISRDLYTGLRDKNGKEVYGGDVYKYENGDTYKVVFSGGGFTGQEVPDEFDSGDFELSGINNDYAEVIGNIYENPELLESEDKCHE